MTGDKRLEEYCQRVDVFHTVHNHGLPLYTLLTEEETRNIYCLLLVD